MDDFPEPETPVKIVSWRLGIWSVTSLRLFSRAPRMEMNSVMGLDPAKGGAHGTRPAAKNDCSGPALLCISRAAPLGGIRQREHVQAGEQQQEERRQRRV